MSTKPQVQAMVVADRVYVDRLTQKCIIAGTFNAFRFPEFPAAYPETFFIYVCLNDVRIESSLSLHFVNLKNGMALYSFEGIKVVGNDPLRIHEVVVQVSRGIPVPHAGEYSFELHCGDEMLAAKRITAVVVGAAK